MVAFGFRIQTHHIIQTGSTELEKVVAREEVAQPSGFRQRRDGAPFACWTSVARRA